MRTLTTLVIVVLTYGLPLAASSIDVTHQTFVTIPQGQDLMIQFGVWNYGHNNPGVSPYPTAVGLLAMGPVPGGHSTALVPGTTIPYFPDFLLEATLESLDGSMKMPLTDPNVSRLGLGVGSLVVTRGTTSFSGSSRFDVATLSASASFSLTTSHALFGSNLGNYNNAAVIRIRNLGPPFTIGLGPPYTVATSIWEPGISGEGPAQTAGIPGRIVELHNPEPCTALLIAVPAGLLWCHRVRSGRLK